MNCIKKQGVIFTYIIFLLTIVFSYLTDFFSEKGTVANVIGIMFLIMFFCLIICCFTIYIWYIKYTGHNLMECDDEIFSLIDQSKKCYIKNENFYRRQIKIINFYYQKDGKVDELVSNKQIERLFAREDFLLKQKNLYNDFATYFYSLTISMIASAIYQILQNKSVGVVTIGIFICTFLFFAIAMLKYKDRGELGSYKYLVDEYEINLLKKKIAELQNSLIMADEDIRILQIKQSTINGLVKIGQKSNRKKQKKEIRKEISEIKKLNLSIANQKACYIQKIYINKESASLVYHEKNNNKKDNYIGKLNLINEEYIKLYEILCKYQLISYDEPYKELDSLKKQGPT